MSMFDLTTYNPYLRVSLLSRVGSLVKWLFARPEERRGCMTIGQCGGTYDYVNYTPFASRTHHIYIRKPFFNDNHMEHLRPFCGLVTVDIGDTSVTERGVECLLGCKSLRYLFLWGTRVGDGVLEVLEEMQTIDMLNLSGTRISRKVFDQICGHLPNAFVSHREFGDHFRELNGKEAITEWRKRDEPSDIRRWQQL